MTDPLTPERLAELRRIATGEDWSPPQPEDVAALLGEIDRLTTALSDSQAECGALRGELIKAFGERDTMHRRAYSAYVRADSIRALAEQLRKLTRFMLDGEPRSPGWGTAELLARQVLMAIGPAMPYGASPTPPQRLVTTLAVDFPPEAPAGAQRPAEDFRTYRCPTPCDSDCEARCHEGHQVGYEQTHNVAECQARCAAAEAYRRIAPKPVDLGGELDDLGPEQIAELKRISGYPAETRVCTGCDGTGERRDFNTDGDVESAQRCPACDGAGRVAIEIAPEDEGISSADVQAQIAEDQYMNTTTDCPDCHAYGRTRDGDGLTAQPCPRCKGTGRVPDARSDVLKPEEWCDRYGIRILDPHGWRRASDPRDWDEPIPLPEFWNRAASSTVSAIAIQPGDNVWSRIAHDADAIGTYEAHSRPRPVCPDCGHPETNCACG